MHVVVVILAICAILITPVTEATAQPDAATPDQRVVVSVSPFVYARPGGLGATSFEAGRDAVIRGMERYVATARDPVEFAPASRVVATLKSDPTYSGKVELGRGFAEIGFTRYRELEPGPAADNLRRAYEEFQKAGHDFVAPSEVSEVLLYQALASLEEQSDPGDSLNVMKEMLLLDPSRVVDAGSFPDEVVTFYESALLDLERDIRDRGPDRRLASTLATAAEADYVLVANVLPGGGSSVELVVWLYEAGEQQFRTSATLEIENPTVDRLRSAGDYLASQLVACLIPSVQRADTPEIPSASGNSRFTLNLNFAYASFYAFPDVNNQPVEPFDNLGAAIGGGYFVTREFALLAMFQFLGSTSEYSGLVQPGFTTLRFFAGGELGLPLGRFRLSLGTLLEGAALSTITTCPGGGVEARRECSPSVTLSPRFLFGINARPRLSFQLLEAMQVYLAGSTSFYFVPLAGNEFNFLSAGELGLQYRF